MQKRVKIYDISLPISQNLAVWPGDSQVKILSASHISKGDICTTSTLTLSAHTGTHIDAPSHFIVNGDGVDAIDLHILVGQTLVIEALNVASLTASVLESLSIPTGYERILFHTRNSRDWKEDSSTFKDDYVAISEDGAKWLASHDFRLVGIDSLSIAPFISGEATHQLLLSKGVVIVEGLQLHGISQGVYELICLPLKMVGIDGAPARAILVDRPTNLDSA